MTSKHQDDFCLNCLHSFATENKLKKVCEKNDFCNVIMPYEDTEILEFNQYQKFDQAPFITQAGLFQCLQYLHLEA